SVRHGGREDARQAWKTTRKIRHFPEPNRVRCLASWGGRMEAEHESEHVDRTDDDTDEHVTAWETKWLRSVAVGFAGITAWALWAMLHPARGRPEFSRLESWFRSYQESSLVGVGCDLHAVLAGPADHEGWAVGNWGLVLHTVDDGQNWEKEPLKPPPGSRFE